MVVFRAQQKVSQKNGDGSCSNNHKTVANKQKAKHVVDLVEPQRVVNIIDFDKNGTEWKDTGKCNRRKEP